MEETVELARAWAQKTRAERRLVAQYAVTKVLAESATLMDAGHEILRAIGESLNWELGMFWNVDEQADVLRFVDLWHAPYVEASTFCEDSRGRTFQRGVGLIGHVWASGSPVWMPDVVTDHNFRRAPMAARVGLHGACAFPVRKGLRIYGVIEFFSSEIREPDQDVLDMVADIGIKVGQFVDREQTAEALRQAEALAEVARLLGDIGHDIKNMLMPIVSGATLLEEELDECYGRLPETVTGNLKASRDLTKELTSMIQRGSRRIQDRVREMAESVKGITRPPEFAPCRISDVVSTVYASLRILAHERKIALQVDGLDTLPLIRADESRLFNAIYNLVNNAIAEVPPDGSINVRGSIDPAGTSVCLSVIDTGKGMLPEVRASLFTYRAISRKVGGTGLGTKIVKDVVSAHGGTITDQSEPGKGTVFHITLPLEGPPPHSGRVSGLIDAIHGPNVPFQPIAEE
jgi:signal transduction histidine kinase